MAEIPIANGQKMFQGKKVGDKTWCNFANVCLNSESCDKVLTQDIVDSTPTSDYIMTFVHPPKDCFDLDTRKIN